MKKWFSIKKSITISIEKHMNGDYHIIQTITRKGWFGLGQSFQTFDQWRGSPTVFYEYPSGQMCDAGLCLRLCEVVRRYEWKQEENRNRIYSAIKIGQRGCE